jgi:hypothetical protein
MRRECVAVVSDTDDVLAQYTMELLESQGISVLHVRPSSLGDMKTTLRNNTFIVNDQVVRGIFFRAPPDSFFSEGFEEEDQSFVDSEIRSVWLAAFQLGTILSINRYDATAWFETLHWPTWRRVLIEATIDVSPIEFGGGQFGDHLAWCPYNSALPREIPGKVAQQLVGAAITRVQSMPPLLVVTGQVIQGEASPAATAAIPVLEACGVCIAEIRIDQDGKILTVDSLPYITDADVAHQAARLIGARFHAHLYHR